MGKLLLVGCGKMGGAMLDGWLARGLATSDVIVAEPVALSQEEREQLKAPEGYKLEITVKPGMPLGAFREEIVVDTDYALQPQIPLIVTGNVSGPISVVPERLRMVNVSTGKGGAGEVTLLVRGGKATQFEVEQKPEKVDAEAVRKSLPRGTVTVKVVKGGLDIPEEDGHDEAVIASAAVEVRYDLP